MITKEQDQMIRQNSTSQRDYDDNLKCFLTFGHLFNYNPLACISQTYCLKGKPALNADAMSGIVRNWVDPTTGKKLCAILKCEVLNPGLTDWKNNPDQVGIRYVAMRTDELAIAKEYGLQPPVHEWVYTMRDAMLRDVTNHRTWKQMPLVMCGKRALTAICRNVFPEIIGTANSPDELAEMILNDEEEIYNVTMMANGEKPARRSSRPPQPSQPPQPSHKVVNVPAPEPEPNAAGRQVRTQQGWESFVKDFGGNPAEVMRNLEAKGMNPSTMIERQHYLHSVGPLANRGFTFQSEDDVKEMRNEDAKPIVETFAKVYGPCALEIIEENYTEALEAYVKTQSMPWRVELIKLFNEHHEQIDESERDELKKHILVANHWGEYQSMARYILNLIEKNK